MASPLTFLKQARDELQKVKWPTRDEIIRLTLVVLIVSTVVGAYIGALDFVMTWVMELILK